MLAVVSLAMFALFAVLILTLPKGYESHMKLRLGSEEAAQLSNSTQAKGTGRESRVKLAMEVLKSPDTLTQVVVRAGLQKLELGEDHGTGETSPLTIEKALQRLQQDQKVEQVGESNVVEVTYSGPSSELATATLQQLAAIYPRVRLKVYGEPGNSKFLHRQRAAWRQQMDDAENELVHFRRRYSEFVLPEEREALGRRSVEAQGAFEQADAQVAQYRSKVAVARQNLKAMSPARAAQNTARLKSEAVGRAVMLLVDLMGRRVDLEGRAPLDVKLVRDSDERIHNAKMALNGALTQGSGNSADTNPVQQSAEVNLIASETELAGLEAQRKRLRQISEVYKEQMFRLADAEVRDDALLRQVKQTEEEYLRYSKWQEESIAAEGLTKEHLADFGVVDRPTIPLEPSTPHVAIDLALSLLLSVCCGLAAALWAEYLTPTALRRYSAVRTIPADFEPA